MPAIDTAGILGNKRKVVMEVATPLVPYHQEDQTFVEVEAGHFVVQDGKDMRP